MEAEIFDRLEQLETSHWWFRARRKIIDSLIRKHAYRGEPLKILEAGSGTGGNLSMLAAFGDVSAFELDADACRVARERGFEVAEGALPNNHPFLDQRFDLIVLFDVLEHVKEDQASLEALIKQLTPGGILFITVPAFPFLWSVHDEKHHHFRRYRRHQLVEQLVAAGFEMKKASYFNFWLFPLIAGVRLMKNLVGSSHSDVEGRPLPVVNGILRLIFSSERFLLSLGSLPFGVSLLAIARRPKS